MADQPSAAGGVLRRPFREQLAFFRGKLARQLPTERWDDLTRAEHDTAFVVAGATKADLLSDLAAATDRAIAEGKNLEAFRKDFEHAVATNGWEGWTGSGTKGGRAWRTRTIYRTNAATSYAAGRHAQLVEGKFPLWVYRHGGSREPRPEHLDLDGLILPADHAFWAKYYPPSDWGCSCYVLGARSVAGAVRLGGDPTKRLPDSWNEVDPATGTPPGIGKGWDYPPGASVASAVNAAAEKVRHWDHRIAKGFMAGLPEAVRDQLAASYRALPSVADDARRYARRVLAGEAVEKSRTLGLVTSQAAAQIGAMLEAPVDLFDFALTPSEILHIDRGHGDPAIEGGRGQRAIGAEDYARLPAIIAAPDRIEDAGTSDIGERLVRYVKRIGGKRHTVVFARRGKTRSLALKTYHIAN